MLVAGVVRRYVVHMCVGGGCCTRVCMYDNLTLKWTVSLALRTCIRACISWCVTVTTTRCGCLSQYVRKCVRMKYNAMNMCSRVHVIRSFLAGVEGLSAMAMPGEAPYPLLEAYRNPADAPLRKLTADLIKTYRKINEVGGEGRGQAGLQARGGGGGGKATGRGRRVWREGGMKPGTLQQMSPQC